MSIKKIIILGSANAMKPQIILEQIVEQDLLKNIELIYLCEKNEGCCVEYCIQNNIKIHIVSSIYFDTKECIEDIKKLEADILISMGWPYKVPKELLDIFEYKSLNCHGSILPDYRGSRSYMHYWANMEEYYGATIHYMTEKFDDGNILISGKLRRLKEESPIIIHRRTAELCGYLLPQAINLVEQGYKGTKGKGTKRYFYKISRNKFRMYYFYNRYLTKLGFKKKLTPYKIVE